MLASIEIQETGHLMIFSLSTVVPAIEAGVSRIFKISHRTLIAGALVAGIGVSGCATGAQTGALIGAGAGAAIGSDASRPGRRGEGALIGAAIGGILGAIIGSEADRDRYRDGDYEYENEVSRWNARRIRTETRQQRDHNSDLRREFDDLERLAEDSRDPSLSRSEREEAREIVVEQQERARDALRAVEYRIEDVEDALSRRRMTPRRRDALRNYRRSLENARSYLEDILSIRV
jgi:hypothetical protein